MILICTKGKMKRIFDISNCSIKDVKLFSKIMLNDDWDIMIKGCVR